MIKSSTIYVLYHEPTNSFFGAVYECSNISQGKLYKNPFSAGVWRYWTLDDCISARKYQIKDYKRHGRPISKLELFEECVPYKVKVRIDEKSSGIVSDKELFVKVL